MHAGFALLTLFPGRVGGSETLVRGLLEAFAAGHGPTRVTVLANRHVAAAYADRASGPVRIHQVRSYRAGKSIPTRALAMAWARVLPRAAARDVPAGLDVVHYPVTVPIPDVGGPGVVTVHDLQHRDLPRFFGLAERRYRRWAYDGAARSATLVVTPSAYTKERLVELLGLAPELVETVHHGVDHALFNPRGTDDERALAGLRLPRRFLVYPANLWPHKNHDRLLEGFALAADRELELVLSGQAYGRLGRLRRRTRELGVERQVRHVGHLPRDALAALYRAATALVFPSLYEGFGAPPLEAMACGCPVAASGRTSLPEVCGDAALLFDPESPEAVADAIGRVTGDASLRERLRAAGPQRASHFTWEDAARRHTAIYERAAATPPPRRG